MSPRRIAVGRAGAIRVVIALVVGSACLGAAAYAATGNGNREIGVAGSRVAIGAQQHGSPSQGREERPPRVRLLEFPAANSTASSPQFRFHVPPRSKETESQSPSEESALSSPRRRFQCKLDDGRWISCASPHRLVGLAPGGHSFAVRALSRESRPGPDAAYGWQQIQPASAVIEEAGAEGKPFSIEQTGSLVPLLPGDPAQPVSLTIGNPNSAPIEVTSLTATVSSSSPGCAAENFELTASNVSATTPLMVPAEGSVAVPSGSISAPSIALLDLPVNQDACQGAELELALSGEARG